MSAPVQHATVSKEHMHDPYRWIVADDAARLALSVLSIDVGKWLRQTGDNTVWELVSEGPAVWRKRGVTDDLGTAASANTSETSAATKVPLADANGLIDDAWLKNRTFNTVAEMEADTDIKLGQTIGVYDYATGNNSGVLFFKAGVSTGAADGGRRIDSVGVPGIQFQQNFPALVSVKMFGAASGADSTAAFLAAVAAFSHVFAPRGNYILSDEVEVTDCRLFGIGVFENDAPWTDDGTVLSMTVTGKSMIRLGRGGCVDGINFYYPDQVDTLVAPIVYPPTIISDPSVNFDSASVKNVCFINSYQCMKFGDPSLIFAMGRVMLENIQAYAIYNFIEAEYALDVINLNNFIVSPGVFKAGNSNLAAWSQDNGIAFIAKKTVESILADNGLVFGLWRGIAALAANSVSLWSFSNVDFDAVLAPLVVTSTSRITNFDFSGCEFLSNHRFDNTITEPAQIRLTGTADDGTITFSGCVFQSARSVGILIDGDAMDTVNITGCEFKFWGASTAAAGVQSAISVSTADVNLNIVGNTFLNNYTASVGAGLQLTNAQSVVGTGNTFKNCDTPIRQTVGTVGSLMLSGNTTIGTTGTKSLQVAGTVTNSKTDDNLFDAISDLPISKVGTASPEGVVTAVVGSDFIRLDGGAGTSRYFKESGTGNTGWVAK